MSRTGRCCRTPRGSIQYRRTNFQIWGGEMAYSESYTCDVCGKKKESEGWWLAWVDCFPGQRAQEDQPLIKLTRWQAYHAHSDGVRHLCGARCAGTLMDRWMTEQHADPDAHCQT
jgi:hypothetical protein